MKKLACILVLIGLGGCASKDDVIPTPDKNMMDIYHNRLNTGRVNNSLMEARMSLRRSYRFNSTANILPYLRDGTNEIKNLFPRLHNPDLVMFVYPHLATSDDLPVPGYTTVFPMFKKIHYAMPGEPEQQK